MFGISKRISFLVLLRATFAGFVCVWLLVSTNCENLRYDGTRNKPPLEALVGTWIPDGSARNYMRDEGGYDISVKTKLVLESDGTYKMSNMPDWWWNEGMSHKEFRSEMGTWVASPDQGTEYYVLILRAHEQNRGAELLGQKAPYKLRFNFGHIDDNKYIIFVKEE